MNGVFKGRKVIVDLVYKIERDNYSHDETVRKEAELKGRHDRNLEIAREMKKADFSIEQIGKLTGLSKEEIESLDQ